MVDFPDAPSAGDTWTEENTTWVYRDPPGAWLVVTGDAGDPVTIVEADAEAGWQVWGDTLIQWGEIASGADGVSVPFPKAFASKPIVTVSADRALGGSAIATTNGTTTTDTYLRCYRNTDDASVSRVVQWVAVGEAPDDLKQPKTVQTVGGSELQEFHDPSNEFSWSIVGSRLECWGHSTAADNTVITFPKTFANSPAVTITPVGVLSATETLPYSVNAVTTTTFQPAKRYANNGGAAGVASQGFSWHAIGEWSGT